MTYISYLYTWIFYCTHQYLSLKFGKKIKKILLDLILDWDLVILIRFFFIWILNMEIYLCHFFKDFYDNYSLNSFLKGHVLNLEKLVFEMKLICTFRKIEYLRWEFQNSILHKSFKTHIRIYTNFDEWKQQVLLSIKHIGIHSSSKIWMPQPLGVNRSCYFLLFLKLYD
jgi:hypothetical protein